jgi:uncharacterized protein YbjT (DUF2867 family)
VKILIAGATGLTGREVLQRLLADSKVEDVLAIGRRSPPSHPKLKFLQIPFSELAGSPQAKTSSKGFSAAISCLGTTLRAAGSREAFKDLDFGANLEFAKFAQKNGVQRFVLLSALGAGKESPFFYSQVKGELESAVKELQFQQLWIVRPGLLIGERQESRPVEFLMQKVSPYLDLFLWGKLAKYRSIKAEALAEVLVRLALDGKTLAQNTECELVENSVAGLRP